MPKKNVEKKLFTLEELKPAKHYRIKVKSFNKDKKLTGESPWIIFETAGKSNAPPDVTNLEGDFRGTQLVVKWDAPWKDSVRDFKDFVVKIESPGVSQEKNFAVLDEKFTFSADQNRNLFNSFRGVIKVTVYSRDRSDNKSNGVSITATAQVPENPTNVKLTAATLGYNVSWDLPLFDNYDYTRIYESSTQNGTYSVVRTERGSSTYVPRNNFNEVWVKVSHVNKAGVESNLVASVPPSIIPIDPVPVDVNPPNIPTNLNWEDPEVNALDSTGGITTASKRAHWQVSDIASGYKVRVSENQQNWAVYDVPASRASVTFKQASGTTATLTVTAHSFSQYDYITVFNVGAPFDGKFKVTATTATTISYTLPSASTISQTAANGTAVISSYTVKELTPGTTYYGSILAYDGANNLTQFVSDGQFATTGTAGQVGSALTIAGTSMKFGPAAGGAGNNGLFINSSNYWYSTGYFNVGTSGNSLSWNGVRLRLDGGIIARSGSFSGNVFLAGNSTENDSTASLIAAPYHTIQSASWSSGVATVILSSLPNPAWEAGDVIVISEASRDFDGQFVLSSASGATLTFSMSSDSLIVPSITNVGKVARVNTGDRVIFNSYGLQGFEDNSVIFSINRNKTSKIGGWTIKPAKIFAGAGNNSVGLNSAPGSTVRIYAGAEDPDQAPFRVYQSGNIRAYGLFSSLDTDSGTRISIGSDVSGTKDGLLIDDISDPGNQNFWYVPSTVSNGNAFFQVGTLSGSAISVKKNAQNGLPKVEIKDYNIVGVAKIIDQSSISIIGVSESIDLIKIGKNVDPRTGFGGRDGISINTNNFWTLSNDGSNVNFRVGDTSSNYLFWDGSKLTISGDVNVTGGNAATNSGVDDKIAALSVRQKLNGEVTGVEILASGIIRSLNKTYNSTTAGWILDYNAGTPRFEIGKTDGNYLRWTGSGLEIKGSILSGSDIGSGTTIPGGSLQTHPTYGSGIGLNGNKLFLTNGYGGGIIVFSDGSSSAYGSIGPSNGSKFSGLEGGSGVIIGQNGYPSIEIGKDSSNANKILMYTGSTVGIEIRQSNVIIRGGSSSRIRGIGTTDSVPSGKRILYGNDISSSSDDLVWGPVPTGGSSGVSSFNGRTGAVTLANSDITGLTSSSTKVTWTLISTAASVPSSSAGYPDNTLIVVI